MKLRDLLFYLLGLAGGRRDLEELLERGQGLVGLIEAFSRQAELVVGFCQVGLPLGGSLVTPGGSPEAFFLEIEVADLEFFLRSEERRVGKECRL